MSTKAKEPSEGDVIIARTLSSYAQLRANLASWGGLSANPAAEKVGQEDEEEDFFTAEPEMGGVGYVAPQDGDADTRQSKITTDKLKKQMLGKRARGLDTGLERVDRGPQKMALPRNGVSRIAKEDDDSEAEEGRSAVGKRRRHGHVQETPSAAGERETRASHVTEVGTSAESSMARKRPGNYLDDLLAERLKKKEKKMEKAKLRAPDMVEA